MRILLLLLASCLIISCAHTPTPSVPVEFRDRETLFFTGRGAAAGIMMDAYLGGAGVAIGIAIDEGIAKDISAAILKADPEFDMRKLVREQLQATTSKVTLKNWQRVVVEKYGFKIVDGDYVIPVLELAVDCKAGVETHRFEWHSENYTKAGFDLIKRDGVVGVGLLQQAVEETLQTKNLVSLCSK